MKGDEDIFSRKMKKGTSMKKSEKVIYIVLALILVVIIISSIVYAIVTR